MNKPFLFAVAMFTAVFGVALARSYFTHEEFYGFIEFASALGIAVIVYAVEQRRQHRAKSESDDL